MSATITILILGTLSVLAGIALVVNHRRLRRELDEREADLEERIHDLRERQTAQVKRLERERDRVEETAHLELVEDLLDVVDDFDNALGEYDDLADEHREGLEMTRRKLLRTLEDHGVDRIDPDESESFDPEVHEALRAVDPEGADPRTVVQVHRPGYRFDERVLRPAAVDVAVGRQTDEEADDGAGEPSDTDEETAEDRPSEEKDPEDQASDQQEEKAAEAPAPEQKAGG